MLSHGNWLLSFVWFSTWLYFMLLCVWLKCLSLINNNFLVSHEDWGYGINFEGSTTIVLSPGWSWDLGVAGTHPRHVLHENSEGLLIVVPQTAVVLNNALVMQVFQQLDFALQSTDLLYRDDDKSGNYTLKIQMTAQQFNIQAAIYQQCIFVDLLISTWLTWLRHVYHWWQTTGR